MPETREDVIAALLVLLRLALQGDDVPGPGEMQPLKLEDNFVCCYQLATGEEIDAALFRIRTERAKLRPETGGKGAGS